MTDYKLVLADPKTGKCYQREIKDAESEVFLGKKLGEKIKGDSFGLSGYEFEITGGSDSCGFPMRKDVNGVERKKVLVISGVGVKIKRKGQRQRKTVRGRTIGRNTSQINLKIIKYGKSKLGAVPEGIGEGESKEEESKKDSPTLSEKESEKESKAKEEKPKEEVEKSEKEAPEEKAKEEKPKEGKGDK